MAQRHERRSADQWQAIVEQYNESGLKVKEFCQQHGYALATFSKWRRRLSLPPQSDQSNKAFVPVVATTAASPSEHSSVTLQIGQAVTLSIRVGGVDGEL